MIVNVTEDLSLGLTSLSLMNELRKVVARVGLVDRERFVKEIIEEVVNNIIEDVAQ